MMNESFSDLPDALVQDLLNSAMPIAEDARVRLKHLQISRDELRNVIHQASLIHRKADLEISREPSVVGIDGSYQLHRLTSLDLCAAAAVAVEGTAKEAKRHWQEPYHRFWAKTILHNQATTLALRGLMIAMELDLAINAPHDLVLIDGSFASLIIYLNQGLSNVSSVPVIGEDLMARWESENLIEKLVQALSSERTIALPKYTSRNELEEFIENTDSIHCDGRTLATLILEPGEYTAPLPIYEEDYHLPNGLYSEQEDQKMNFALSEIKAIYFRPFRWVPALRLEVPGPIANSQTRLSLVLRGIESQFLSPAIVEPYPLFLADRMVKSLGAGVAVMEHTISQYVTDDSDDIELTTLLLQNYRTESGRGGV